MTDRRPYLFILVLILSGLVNAHAQDAKPDGSPPAKTEVASETSPDRSGMKVSFDDASPGVVIVEAANGEKIRVDTTKKTVEQVALASTAVPKPSETQTAAVAATAATTKKTDDKYDFDKGEEPYDYRIVNVPTPKNVPRHSWNLVFTHRFSEPLHPLSRSAPDLLGLDSFAVPSFGLSYGITDKFYLSAYRSAVCQTGMCKVIEIGAGYNWVAMDKDRPYAVTTYASIEGNDNFTEEYTYNLQVMLAARVGKRLHLFFSPAVHINSNGQRRFDPRPTDFFPRAPIADTFRLPKHGASFGFGAEFLITPNVVALFDYAPRTGFKLGRVRPIRNGVGGPIIGFENMSEPSIGFGIQRNIGKHSFALTFSNTQTTTTSKYNSSNLVLTPKHVIIGFNLTRRF